MDVINQKCDGCGSVNTTGAVDWVRVFGVATGNVPGPIMAPAANRMFSSAPRQTMDFCRDCASKTSVAMLTGILLGKK